MAEEVFRRIMEDPEVEEVLSAVNALREKYGEHGDRVLGYVMGALSNLYDEPAEAVFGFEVIKASMVLRDLGLSGDFVSKVARERKPSTVSPA